MSFSITFFETIAILTDLDFVPDMALLFEETQQAPELLLTVTLSIGRVAFKCRQDSSCLLIMREWWYKDRLAHCLNGLMIWNIWDLGWVALKKISWSESLQHGDWKFLGEIIPPKDLQAALIHCDWGMSARFWLWGMELIPKSLDGAYTIILRAALNVHWNRLVIDKSLCGKPPKFINTFGQRCFAGQCTISKKEQVFKLEHIH